MTGHESSIPKGSADHNYYMSVTTYLISTQVSHKGVKDINSAEVRKKKKEKKKWILYQISVLRQKSVQ